MTNQNIIFHDLAKFIMLKTLDDLLLMKLTPLYYNEKNKTYNLYYFYNTIEQLIDECKDFINSPCYCMQLPFRSRVRTVLNNLLNLKKKNSWSRYRFMDHSIKSKNFIWKNNQACKTAIKSKTNSKFFRIISIIKYFLKRKYKLNALIILIFSSFIFIFFNIFNIWLINI